MKKVNATFTEAICNYICLLGNSILIINLKSHIFFLTGDWHQYDDIICAEPSKNVLKRLKEKFWPEERKNLIQGREIAGNVMLETIFDLLRSWTDANLSSFLIQLNQFFQVYGEPFVYEEKQKKWSSLDYGKDDVSSWPSHSSIMLCLETPR